MPTNPFNKYVQEPTVRSNPFDKYLQNEQTSSVAAPQTQSREQLISQIPMTGSPAAPQPQPQPASGMLDYLGISGSRGATVDFARLMSGSAQQQGTFAGAFPTQPELEGLTTENIQRRMGVDMDTRPATQAQRFAGAGVEGLTSPINLAGLPAAVPARAAILSGAVFSGVGGEFGGDVGAPIGGAFYGEAGENVGRVAGGLIFALGSGAGALKGAESLFSMGKGINLKNFDVEDLAGLEGSSKAKDLVDKALVADPNLNARLQDIKKKIDFVGGKSSVLATGGIDNVSFRTNLEKLIESDPSLREPIKQLYKDLQDAVQRKSAELYPQASVELPSVQRVARGIQIDFDKRLAAISDQQTKLTQSLNLGDAPVELGKAIQNLTLAREAAARNALSPDYNSVKAQASAMGAILPAAQTQVLLDTAKDLFMQDPWGRQSSLLKMVENQSSEFERLRARTAPAATGQTLPSVTGDLSAGLDITSLDSLKRRVAEDIRTIRSDSTRDKLVLLQQRVDDALNQVQSSAGDVNVNFRGQPTTFGKAMEQLDSDYYNKVGIPFKDADAVQKIGAQDYAERIAPQLASSPTAMSQFLRIAGDEGPPLAEKALMSKLYTQSLNKDGFVDPNKLNALLTKTSNNGGYSDILTQLPELQGRLSDVAQRADFLSAQRVSIDDAAKAERIRVGDSFLATADQGGVEAVSARMLGANGQGYHAKFMRDLKKLPLEDQTNATLAVRNAMVTKMLDSKTPFDFLTKNEAAYRRVFGKAHVDNLKSLADVQRLATKIDVDQLPLNAIAMQQMGTVQRLLGGVDPKRLTGIFVNQIASVFNKGFRIAALVGQENLDVATREAQRKLFMDPNGLDSTIKATTRIMNKSGEDVDLAAFVKPKDLLEVVNTLGMSVARSGYLGGSVAASESEVMAEDPESFYEYTPRN